MADVSIIKLIREKMEESGIDLNMKEGFDCLGFGIFHLWKNKNKIGENYARELTNYLISFGSGKDLTIPGCQCTLSSIAAHMGLIEVFKYFKKRELSQCPNHGNLIDHIFIIFPGKTSGDQLQMLNSLPEDTEIDFNQLTKTQDPEIASLILKKNTQKAIDTFIDPLFYQRYYHPHIWQTLATFDGMVKEKLIKNEDEMVLYMGPEEIEQEYFILLENGIFWDIRNLDTYLRDTVKGNNKYDSNCEFGDLDFIWTRNDLEMLSFHSAMTGLPIGQKLVDFLNINSVLAKIPLEVLEAIGYTSNVLSLNHQHFWQLINQATSNYQKEIIAQLQNDQDRSKEQFPRGVPNDISQLVDMVKARGLQVFYSRYMQLSDDLKQAIYNVNSSFTQRYLTELVEGNECMIGGSHNFSNTWSRIKDWVLEQGGDLDKFFENASVEADDASAETDEMVSENEEDISQEFDASSDILAQDPIIGEPDHQIDPNLLNDILSFEPTTESNANTDLANSLFQSLSAYWSAGAEDSEFMKVIDEEEQ